MSNSIDLSFSSNADSFTSHASHESIQETWKQDPKFTIIYKDGGVYMGHFKIKIKGNGKQIILKDQRTITADWKSTEDSVGSIQFIDNSEYKGEIKKGMRHGQGEQYNHEKKLIYKGNWLNDLKHGQGEECLNGRNYIVEYEENKLKQIKGFDQSKDKLIQKQQLKQMSIVQLVHQYTIQLQGKVYETNGLSFVNQDCIAAGCVNSKNLQIINTQTEVVQSYPTIGEALSISQAKNNILLAGQGFPGVCLYDKDINHIQTYLGPKNISNKVLFEQNQQKILSGGIDSIVYIWDSQRTEPIMKLQRHTQIINDLCLLDENTLVSVSLDKLVQVWDLRTGEYILSHNKHQGSVNTVKCYDETICSGSDDKCLIEWQWMNNLFLRKESDFPILTMVRAMNSKWLINKYHLIDVVDFEKEVQSSLTTVGNSQIQCVIATGTSLIVGDIKGKVSKYEVEVKIE